MNGRIDRTTVNGELRLDRLLGRVVTARDGTRAGRLEEVIAEMRGAEWVVTSYVIGTAGLLERLGLGVKLLIGRHNGGDVARWDQVDLSDPEHPRLTCLADGLRPL